MRIRPKAVRNQLGHVEFKFLLWLDLNLIFFKTSRDGMLIFKILQNVDFYKYLLAVWFISFSHKDRVKHMDLTVYITAN